MQVQADISRLSETVIALRAVRDQIKQRIKLLPKDAKWSKEARAVLATIDALEESLHNPKATVTADIVAMKGGAKLYSQLAPLYYALMDSDAPLTQGLRETHAEHAKELRRLADRWRAVVGGDLHRLNDLARDAPVIVVPSGGTVP
jgi:hypothetical protein